jgi:hypothetical protein
LDIGGIGVCKGLADPEPAEETDAFHAH